MSGIKAYLNEMESSLGAERLVESRFRFFINLLKIGGVSVLDSSVSRSYRAYCVLCYVAEYTTLIAMILEICLRPEDLDNSMDVAMVLMLFLGISFVQFYFRYYSDWRKDFVIILVVTEFFFHTELICWRFFKSRHIVSNITVIILCFTFNVTLF